MQDEVSETESIRKNLSIERKIVEGCDILLDVEQCLLRQGINDQFIIQLNHTAYIFLPNYTYSKLRLVTIKSNTSFHYRHVYHFHCIDVIVKYMYIFFLKYSLCIQ